MNELKKITMDNSKIQKCGRGYVIDGRFPLFYTGSGVEFELKASELWFEFTSDFHSFESWVSVILNGVRISRFMVPKGTQKFCIFRNMNPETVKNIRLVKDTQALRDDPEHFLSINAIYTDGEIVPYRGKKLKIEVIGDSISSGEGLIGAKKEEDWIPCFFDSVNQYGTILAAELNADLRVLSQSGWGVVCGWDNNPNNAIPKIYDSVCACNLSEEGKRFGSLNQHDFSSWQPDIIIVNLGTNDTNAFQNPEWISSDGKETFKLNQTVDGKKNRNDLKLFENGVISFLKQIRKSNSKALIIWCYGILGADLEENIINAIDIYRNESKDNHIEFLHFASATEEQYGARWHPGIPAHKMMADMLADKIKTLFELQ